MEGRRGIASRWAIIAGLAPVALAVGAYSRSLRGAFQFDDVEGIAHNPMVTSLARWARSVAQPETLLAGRPLTTLTFAANYAAGRLDPFGYHLVNLAIHVATVALVWLLTRRIAGLAGADRPERIAVGVAGLFALHPIQSQAVCYVSQRAELLSAALYVAALLLLLARDPGARPRPWGPWGAALGAFVLGFAAKPSVITLPVTFLLVLLAVGSASPRADGRGWRRALPLVAVFGAVGGALTLGLLHFLRGSTHAGFSVAGTSPWAYFLTQAQVCVVYLRLLFWPAGQRVDWAFPTSPGLADPATLGALLAVLLFGSAGAFLIARGRRSSGAGSSAARLGGLGILWFFVVLSPTSSFVPLTDNLMEHRVYLASWGIFLAAVASGDWVAGRLGRRRLGTAAWTAVILALAVTLHARNAVWVSEEALWRDAAEKSPASARAQLYLGMALDAQGRTEEAVTRYEAALERAGGNLSHRGKILVALGTAQMVLGKGDAARASFEEGLHFLPNDDGLLASMALLAGGSGEPERAESLARRALRINPAQTSAWVVLGNLALERGDATAALAAYDAAREVDPAYGPASYGRALALRLLGRTQEECGALRDAALGTQLRPEYLAAARAALDERCR